MPDFSPIIPIDLSGGAKPTPDIHVPSVADPRDYNPNYANTALPSVAMADNSHYDGNIMDVIESQNKPVQTPKDIPFNPALQDRYKQLPFNPMVDNEDVYGRDQSSLKQFGSGVVKGIASGVMSFAQALTFQPNATWAEEAKQKMENFMPNYYTEKQKGSNWNWVPFSGGAANFWGDKIVKGTLDMVGMVGAIAVQDAIIGATTEGLGEIPLIGGQIAKISMRASKYFTGIDRSAEFLETMGLEGTELKAFKSGMEAQALKAVKGKQLMLARGLGTNFLFSHYMASQGSVEYGNGLKTDLIQQYRTLHNGDDPTGEDLATIQKDVESATNARYNADLGLFMAQSLALPGLLRAFRPANSLVKGIEAEAGRVKLPEAPKSMADLDNLSYQAPKGGVVFNKFIKPFGKGALVMGGINVATESSSEAIKNYYKRKESGKSETGNVIGDLFEGFGKTLGTSEGIGSILTSSIIGGLVGNVEHTVSSMKARKAGLATPEEAAKTAIDNLNKWNVTGLFKNNYDAVVDIAAAHSDMEDAVKTGDPFKYKNAQKDAFFNFVLSGLHNNMHDVRLEQLKMFRDLPDQELQGVFGDSKTDPTTQRQYIDGLISEADRIQKKYNAIGDLVGQPYPYRQNPKTDEHREQNEEYRKIEGYKDMLTKFSWDKEFWKENLDKIELKNREIHGNLTNDLLERLTTREGRNDLIDDYEAQARDIERTINDPDYYRTKWSIPDQRPERDMYKRLADKLRGIQEMNNFDPVAFSRVFNEALNFELGGRAVKSMADLPLEETMPLVERGVEIQQSKMQQRAADHVYNELFTQSGFDSYAAEADSYKKGQGIADSHKELEEINVEHEKYLADHKPEEGVSKLYTLTNPNIKPYTVSRGVDANGDTMFQVKGWDGDIVSTHEKKEAAEEERDDLNHNTKYPSSLESSGELNDDGSIIAKDENGKVIAVHPRLAASYTAVDTPQEIVTKRGIKNDEVLNVVKDNEGSLPDLPTQTSDMDNTVDISPEDEFKFLRKMKQFVFRSTIPSPFDTSKDYNKRAQHFFSNIGNVKANIRKGNLLRMRMVTSANEAAMGLESLTSHMLKGVEAEYPQDNNGKRLVVAVFQEYDPIANVHHFVDANGNRLVGEKDFDKYIIAPMPTTDVNYKSEGLEGISRFQDAVTKAEQLEEQNIWSDLRKEIFKVTRAEDTPSYDFVLSRGIPRRTELGRTKEGKPIYEQHPVTKAFDVRHKLDSFDQIIQVNTGTYIPDFVGDNVAMPKGSVIFRDPDTFSFQILNNRKLNVKEVDNVFNLLAHYADILDNGIKQSRDVSGYIKFLESKLGPLMSKDVKTPEEHEEFERLGKEINKAKFDHDRRGTSKAVIEDIIDYLGGLTFFNRGRLDAGASKNEIYFSNDRKGTINISGKEFYFTSDVFDPSNRYNNVADIKAALAESWTNVNNKKLGERKPFRELSVENGSLVTREWKSYQHFLLSDKYDLNDHTDDGKDRHVDDIPVTTTVNPLDKSNTLESNYEAKYAIVKDNQEIRTDLKFENKVKKQEKKEPPVKEKKAPEKKEEPEANVIKYAHPLYSQVVGNFEYSIEEDGSVYVDQAEAEHVYDSMKGKPAETDAILMGLGVLDPADAAKTGKEKIFRVKEAIGNLLSDLAAKEWLEREKEAPEVTLEDAQVEAKVEAAKVEEIPFIDARDLTPTETPEEAPKSEPKDKGAVDNYENKPSLDDFDFRFVNAKELDYVIHDIKTSEAWFEKNIPFSGKRLETMINNGGMYAFGRYANMHAEWYKLAKKGTIEHEAFEGIWKSFTTAPERSKLLKEFNSRSGSFFEHNTGREVKYSEANPYEAKEQLAEELGQYVLDGKLYKPAKSTKGNFIGRMFEDFVNWVKTILNGGIKKYFNRINTGYYKDVAPVNDFKGLDKFDTNKALPDLSTSETFNIVRGVTSRVMQFLLTDNRSLVDFDVRGDKGLKKLLEKVHNRLNTEFNDESYQGTVPSRYKLGQADPKHPDAINEAQYRNFQKLWKSMDENWSVKEGMSSKQRELTVEGMVRDYLGTYGVKIAEISNDGEPVETDESESASKKILEDAFTIDVKKNALASIKLLLGTLVDGHIEGGKRIEKRDRATNMPVPVKFGRIFSFLSDTLKDYNTFPEKIDKLRELSITDSNVRDILKRLRIGQTPDKLTLDDIKLRAAFNNTFGKQRPEAWTYYINRDGSTVFSAQNLNVSIRSQRESWADAIKVDAVNQGMVKVKADGTYVFNPEGVKREGGIGTEAGMLRFLNDIGIDFTKEMRNKLSREKAPGQTKSDYDKFNEAVVGIYDQFHKTGLKDKEFSFGATGQAGRFNELAELYLKSLGISDSTYYNIEGKQQSQDVGTNFLSKVSNDINNSKTKDELYQKAPFLNAPFRLDSIYLNSKLFNGNVRTKDLQLSADILQGKLERGELSSNAKPLAAMTHPERVMAEINANLNKMYYVLVPADSKQEWVQKLDHVVTLADFERGEAWDKLYSIFNTYYQTERKIAFEKGNGTIDQKYVSLMHEFAGSYEPEQLPREAVEEIINDRAKGIMQYLKNHGIIKKGNEEVKTDADGNKTTTTHYTMPDINLKFLTDNKLAGEKKRAALVTMTDRELLRLFHFTEANYMINNVEFHKLYFGDPADIKDPLKRYKSFISPRQESLYGDQEFNDILNRELNTLKGKDIDGNKVDISLKQGDYGHFIHSDYIHTFVASDQMVRLNTLADDAGIYPDDSKLGDQIRAAYEKIDPTDGGGFTTIMGHREMTYRKGQVTKDHDRMYNFILAEDRQLMYQDGKLHDREGEKGYYRPELKTYDEATVAKGYIGDAYLNVYKPIYSGVDVNGKTVLDKYSLAPLSYRMVRSTPLEKIYMNMVNEGTHYFVMKSGRKIGVNKTYDLYNQDGKVNDASPSKEMQSTLLWKYFGIQVETEGRHHHNALGTQSSTMVAMNLQSFGIPIDFRANKDWHSLTESDKLQESNVYRLLRHNQGMMTAMQRHGYDILLRKLGIEETEDHDNNKVYTMPDKTKLETLLRRELLQRDATMNQKDALTLNADGEFAIPLDAAANFKQIKQILYSKVEKDIAKIKQNGGPKVMVPGIMHGSVDGKEIHTATKNGKTYLVSSGLKFYEATYEKGKRTGVSRMEVMITSDIPKEMRKHPRWAKATDAELLEHLNGSEEGKKVLEGIGFRIPTQELNSIDSFVVKSFLPDYMGDTIVVPEAITTKAGSDFDIDKLNTYLKSIYVDKDGNTKQVPFFGTDKEAKAKLIELLSKDAYKPTKEIEANDDITAIDEEVLDDMGEGEADKFFKQSLQNEYYDSMSKLVLHPDNFERLIKPNSADKFKSISKALETLAPGEFASDSKGSLLDRMYMSQVRQAFVGGKSDVGIAASNQKNHSLNQLVNLYIDPDRLDLLSGSDKKFLGDARVFLPHNTMMGMSTLSGITDDKGNYISDNLSQCIDGYVDIAKGAWIMNIVQDTSQAGTFMFLLKMGVDPDTAAMFMNQPIIREYVKILKHSGSTFALRDVKSAQRMALQKLFPVGIDTSKKNVKWGQQYNKLINKAQKNGLNIADFEKNIGDYYNSTDGINSTARNIEQHVILKEFLKYTVMADHNFKIQQSLTFDTNPDPDPAMQRFKSRQVAEALNSTIFANVDKLYEQSHIGPLKGLIEGTSSAINEGIFKTGSRELGGPREVINKVIDQYPTRMSKDNKMRASNAAEESLIAYLVQTGSGINSRIHELLADPKTNMAKRLVEFKKAMKEHPDSDLANNELFKELMVSAKKKRTDVKNVFLARKSSDSYTMDMYTDAAREFRDNPLVQEKFSNFYNDLVTTGFLQSGLSNSKQAFAKVIPSEDWARLVAPIILDDMNWQPDRLQGFLDSDVFFRNQWRNKYLTPLSVEEWNRDRDNRYLDSNNRLSKEVLNAWSKFRDENHPAYAPIEVSNAGRSFKSFPGTSYTPFKFAPNSKEGQYRFITFSAVDADFHNRQQDLWSVEDKKQMYLLKRLHDENDNPIRIQGDFIYVPISPRGDGVNAQEYTEQSGPSALKTDCFNIPYEYPEKEMAQFFENLKEENNISSAAPDKDRGTMDEPFEFKMPKETTHLDRIEKGDMTGITFPEKDALNNQVSPGSIIKFTDGDREVYAKAITGFYPITAISHETWARVEGRPIEEWSDENKKAGMQFLFRAIDPISGEMVEDKSPAQFKPIIGWQRLGKKVDFTIVDPKTKERNKEVSGFKINFLGHPEMKLIAYEGTYETKSGATRTGWAVADEATGETKKTYYQNSIKEAIDGFIRTTNREIEDGKNVEGLKKLNLSTKLEKSGKSGTFEITRSDLESAFEARDRDTSYAKDETKEAHIKELSNFVEKLKADDKTKNLSKEEIMEKLKCYFNAPF